MDLVSMIVAELVSKVILTAVFAYLYSVRRERFLGAWTLGWGFSAAFNLALLLATPPSQLDLVLSNVLMLLSTSAFLWGAHQLLGRGVHRAWSVALGAGALWTVGAPLTGIPVTPYHAPLAFLLGAALLFVGWALVQPPRIGGFEAYLTGGAMGLWGLHVIDSPFLRQVEWLAPYGYLVSFALQLTAAVGMLLLYLRRYQASLRDSEAQLAQAQKNEALGRLAGGIAHDFNNLLTVILGSLALVKPTRDNQEPLADAENAAVRAADLTGQLLAFSRRQIVHPKPVDLAAAVRSIGRMLDRVIGEEVLLEVDATDAAWIEADPGHLEQILINLAINARDAMPEGGSLRISTRRVQLEAPMPWSGGLLPGGDYVELVVEDDGTGISQEALPHVFDPFFTTKAVGQGSGLGLAMVRALVQRVGGAVTLASDPDTGTAFRLLFRESDVPRDESGLDSGWVSSAGCETVLLAEDDGGVRELVKKHLTDRGYEVLEARHGAAALELIASRGADQPIDLLVTDVVMPHHSGPAITERFRRRFPDAAVVLMSGYTAGRLESIPPGCRFIAKPFTPTELATVVRETLDARPTAADEGADQGAARTATPRDSRS